MKKDLKAQEENDKKNLEEKLEQRNKALRFSVAIGLLILIVFAIYLPLKLTGSLDKISNPENIKTVILKTGIWGYFTFFVIQFIQVTFIPIPAVVTTIAGTMVFGPWHTLWISLCSVLLASIFAFWLGRKFGKKVVYWIVGKKETEKYEKTLKKGKYVFFLMMLFPGFPDDILCMLAGMTAMSFKYFLTTNLITRPITISAIVFFGSGMIIPFSDWGIYVWILLGILMAIAFYISVKKQQEVENFLIKLSNKLKRKEKNKE